MPEQLHFENVTCRRAPEFDSYAEAGKVPVLDLINAGWWFECVECSTMVSADLEDEDGNELSPVYVGGHVYCSQKCRDSFDNQRQAEAARKQEVIDRALAKWPGIEITYASGYDRDTYASFKFPGGQYNATWRLGADVVSVTVADQEAWKAYQETLKQQ
jgi:hypothetical protein